MASAPPFDVPLATCRRLTSETGRPAVGYLVAAVKDGPPLALPIHEGVTLVGRSKSTGYVLEADLLRGIIESGQWRICWQPSGVTVADLATTNGSVLVPRAIRHTTPLERMLAEQAPGTSVIGWDGKVRHEDPVPLAPGDVLITIYRALVFVPNDAK